MRDREHQHERKLRGRQDHLGEMWLMVVEKRMQFPVIENRYDAKCSLSVYIPGAFSMQLHTLMLDIDVARRALLVISTPPFRTSGARNMRQR